MFNFLKKHKAVYEISEPEGLRERAIQIFSNIEGLDDINIEWYRAIKQTPAQQIHSL
jgi:hypothetical protein